jgi:PleD family two-component response regulator
MKSIEKENILIFNSDPIFFFNITMKLGKNYQVFQSSTAKEFLKILTENSISKIIIDFTTIKEDLLKQIRVEERKNIIAIIDEESNNDYINNNKNILQKIKRVDINDELKNI